MHIFARIKRVVYILLIAKKLFNNFGANTRVFHPQPYSDNIVLKV